jgi:hypothetical protein
MATTESRWNKYGDYGFLPLAAFSQDVTSGSIDAGELDDWVDYYGATFPNLIDPSGSVDLMYDPSSRSRPTYVLLSPGLVIEKIGNSISDAEIEAVLPTPYP